MKEDNITKYLIAIIIALIILIGVIFTVKNLNKKEETNCKECESCEKYETYQTYLNNLKKRDVWKFAKTANVTYIAHEDNSLYVIPNESSSLYKSLKDKFVDVPGYCGVEDCEQGAIITDKKIIDIFQTKQEKKDMIFVLDEEGNLYYLNVNKDSIELKEINEYKNIINVYNVDDTSSIVATDIDGNTHYLHLD